MSDEETKYILDGLEINSSYVIRVAASNKYGIGEFIEFPAVTSELSLEAPTIENAPVITNIIENVIFFQLFLSNFFLKLF